MFNFRRFLMQYFMAAMYVVSDDGGGDFMIDEMPETPETPEVKDETPETPEVKDETPETPETPEANDETPEQKEIRELKEKLETLESVTEKVDTFMSEQENAKLVVKEVAALSGKYPDFDIDSVHNYLNELAKTDPARADMLNNPIGWENIHMQQALEANDGVFLAPRGVSKEPFDMEKVSAKAASGDDRAKIELFDNIK